MLHNNYGHKFSVVKKRKKEIGSDSQGTWSENKLIRGKPPVAKHPWL
jgi:hypothetical protein